MLNEFRPGRTWYDTEGKRIQAHGGSVLQHNGKFYFYGENKEGITGWATGEKCKDWHHGVRMYESTDLYNWEDKGIIMIDDTPGALFYPETIMDRPHILFCEKTGEFVLWAKCCPGGFNAGVFGICTSKTVTGPYKYVKSVQSDPYFVGDFDLVKDNGRAYAIFEHPHTKMICWELSEDFTDFSGTPSEHLPRPYPPFMREAPAHFEKDGRHFLITSGTTGYYPNPSEICSFEDFHSEWTDLGDPCVGDKDGTSFHAQFSSVFHLEGTNLYIAIGDRWLTDLYNTPNMADLFERVFNPKKEPLPEGMTLDDFTNQNTSEANYVWLPIEFKEDGTPFITWKNTWKIEDYV